MQYYFRKTHIQAKALVLAETHIKTPNARAQRSDQKQEALINTKERWGIARSCKMTDRLSLGSFERQWEPSQSGQAIVEGGEEVSFS